MKSKNYEKKTDNFVADETVNEEDVKTTKVQPTEYDVIVSNLALRLGPGTKYERIGICATGAVLVDKVENGFGRLADGSGWICLDYARKI